MAKVKSTGGVLTAGHLDILNSVLAECAKTREECERCNKCGINVDPEAAKNAEQESIASRIKAAYFPNAK